MIIVLFHFLMRKFFPRTYYFYEFGLSKQHVALMANVNSGKVISCLLHSKMCWPTNSLLYVSWFMLRYTPPTWLNLHFQFNYIYAMSVMLPFYYYIFLSIYFVSLFFCSCNTCLWSTHKFEPFMYTCSILNTHSPFSNWSRQYTVWGEESNFTPECDSELSHEPWGLELGCYTA
jgi:hypothetical protein